MLKILTFVLCMLPFSVFANVMTFNNLSPPPEGPHSEDGITAVAVDGKFLWLYTTPGRVLITDPGTTAFTSEIEFTMGGRFNADSFDYFPARFTYYKCSISGGPCSGFFEYESVKLTGERDGVAVASTSFIPNDTPTNFLLGSAFKDIDKFIIQILSPELFDTVHDGEFYYCDIPCYSWDIDNVTLSPVPLPAALPLFGAALIGFAALRRFKRP